MASLNVNMPADLRDYVEQRTRTGGFGTPTEYVRHLIRKDRETESERELERLLVQGLKSGSASGNLKGLFKRLHRRVDQLEAARRRGLNGKTARPKAAG